MGPEANIDSIRTLEQQIKEGTGDEMRLKRARNSLFNISTRVPPEILGLIFRWNVIPDGDFGGLRNKSYNFLLVCHHWFKVACKTPELWNFWGDTPDQWSKRCQHSGTAPVDLVLNGYRTDDVDFRLDGPLRDALRDRVASDSIRSLHIQGRGTRAFRSVMSVLIPDGEDIKTSSIESIILRTVDVSDLFVRYYFPELRRLNLSTKVVISTWDHLRLHTTALTTLSLTIRHPLPLPTASQLLAILASNPRLRDVDLRGLMIPRDNGDGSTSRVPLHHLRTLRLIGDCRSLFQLLHRLNLPKSLDKTSLTLFGCRVEEIPEIGAYLRDYLRRDGRFQDGLGIFITFFQESILIEANTASGNDSPSLSSTERVLFVMFMAAFEQSLPLDMRNKLCIDLVKYAPTEHVTCFRGKMETRILEQAIPTMPNIQELHLISVEMSDRFLRPDSDGPPANAKTLPSLRYLHLEDIFTDPVDWSSLISYLAHQTSGGQAISLRITGDPIHICPHVAENIMDLVEEFVLDLTLDEECPFDICQEDRGDREQGDDGNEGKDVDEAENGDENEEQRPRCDQEGE